MSDIVERLRTSADECEFTTRAKLLREAAAEIARLRSELAYDHKLEEQAAEIERLKATVLP